MPRDKSSSQPWEKSSPHKLSRPAKLIDVARLANCSVATVSNAINGQGRLSDAKREEILNLCKELNYVPNSAGRNLRIKRTETVGMLFAPSFAELFGNVFYARIMEGVADTLREADFDIMLAHDLGKSSVPRIVRQGRVDALMLLGAFDPSSIEQLADCPVPLCMVDSRVAKLDADSVTTNGVDGAIQVVDHLVESGHTNIVMAAYGFPNYNVGQRVEGFRAGLEKHGIGDHATRVCDQYHHNEEILEWLVSRLKGANPPSAVFAVNDTLASDIIKGLSELNIRVPEDVSIVGFNDDSIAKLSPLGLTTVSVAKRNIGATAAKMVLERIRNPRLKPQHEVLPTRLVTRSSVIQL